MIFGEKFLLSTSLKQRTAFDLSQRPQQAASQFISCIYIWMSGKTKSFNEFLIALGHLSSFLQLTLPIFGGSSKLENHHKTYSILFIFITNISKHQNGLAF
jgi:hypothetical protein